MTSYSRETIEAKLRAAFGPERLEVIDESHLHAGHHHGHDAHHPGFDGSPGTHFRVRLAADAMRGLTRLARHRLVNETLRDELAAGVHALAIEAAAPGEATRW